jgi:hypothetical protein
MRRGSDGRAASEATTAEKRRRVPLSRKVFVVVFALGVIVYTVFDFYRGIVIFRGGSDPLRSVARDPTSTREPPSALPEEKPSLAQGTRPLSASQARYCLAQGIRIQGATKVVNTASTAEASRFLALSDDYNPRCGNYHYTPGIMDSVKEEVEARRAALEFQGAALIRPPDAEEKPPVAQGALLPEAQARYCLAQGIRIQGAAKAVNTASTAEASRFLALSDDYNPRCGNYRLAPGVTSSLKAQVEARRAGLEGEGAALVRPLGVAR